MICIEEVQCDQAAIFMAFLLLLFYILTSAQGQVPVGPI